MTSTGSPREAGAPPGGPRPVHEIQNELRLTSPKRARAFAADVRTVGSMLRQFPRAGAPVGSLRRVALQRFQFSILYEIDGDVVRISTNVPQKREPDYWADDDA